jgi:hypothetical protein
MPAGENATPNSGKFEWGAIKSPKQSESADGVLEATSKTLPAGAAKPKK